MRALPVNIGDKFNRLTVVNIFKNTGSGTFVECLCDCGNSITRMFAMIRNGSIKSCGCLNTESRRKTCKQNATTHGLGKPPEYKVWAAMKQRCNNPNSPSYKNYGGRGITLCEAWNYDFAAFYYDMGPRPTPSHSIERINNDLGYSKENCEWATLDKQSKNKRTTVRFPFNGYMLTLGEISEITGIKRSTLSQRIYAYKWPLEKAFSH